MGQILAIAIALIFIFGLLLHLVLRFIFRINALRVLLAATISSVIILLIVVFVHQRFSLSNTELLLLIFPLAIVASFIIAWAEQRFLKISQVTREITPTSPDIKTVPSEIKDDISETLKKEVPSINKTKPESQPVAPTPIKEPVKEETLPPKEKEIYRDLVKEEKKEVFSEEYRGKPEEALDVLIEDAYSHVDSGAIDSAIQSFRLAIVFAEDPEVLIPLQVELGRLWFMIGETSKAANELKKAYDLAKQVGLQDKISEIGSLLESLSEEE